MLLGLNKLHHASIIMLPECHGDLLKIHILISLRCGLRWLATHEDWMETNIQIMAGSNLTMVQKYITEVVYYK